MNTKVKNPFIHSLLLPVDNKASDRRAWSIPLMGVWLPFFMATNTAGETAISQEAIGAPLRLAKEQDGTPKFSKSGKPMVKVAPAIAQQVRTVRDNFVAGLLSYAEGVANAMPTEYEAEQAACLKAGKPIVEGDKEALETYLEAVRALSQASPVGDGASEPAPVGELVTA